ncbi:MAG: hypothetical protein ACRDI0_03805 [Actinomycetota bacterium]
MARWVIAVAGLAAVVALFVVLRPGADDPTIATSPAPSPSPTSTASPTATPTITVTTPDAREIEVEVEEGRVTGPRQVSVPLGRRVIITVEADVTDEVHVHGYDFLADVAPGSPARIRFRADVPGIFEVELEGAHLLLFHLEVRA